MPTLQPGDALILVDIQHDFCPGGVLAVPEGDTVIPVLNRWIEAAERAGVPIYASRDWHPADHVSFSEQGGPWPPHCVQGTHGAELHPDLDLPPETPIITKGSDPRRENYSAFDGTELAPHLRQAGVRRIWVGGLATDYCVRATVLDGLTDGFEVHVIVPAVRPVDVTPGDGERALREMAAAGAKLEATGSPAD